MSKFFLLAATMVLAAFGAAAEDSGPQFFRDCMEFHLSVREEVGKLELKPGDTFDVTIPKRFERVSHFGAWPLGCASAAEEICSASENGKSCHDETALVAREMALVVLNGLPRQVDGVGLAEYEGRRVFALDNENYPECPGVDCDLYAESGRFLDAFVLEDIVRGPGKEISGISY